ncbi:MAG: hypothetical protein WC236_14665 [Gallionellaceae bacterium]|jgi:hypothetical protein
MNAQLKLMAGLVLIAAIIGGMFSLFQYGRHVEGLERDQAAAKAVIQNEAIKYQLQGEKNAAQKRIDDLADELRRARVLLPKCGLRKTDTTYPASGGVQTPASGKPLPEPAEDPQRALDEFMDGTDTAFHEADTTVNDCRVVTEWAKSLCKLYSCVGPK